eukprot:SAG11_NODE_2591_length_3188_cov_40.194238_1_plen_544_part_00
MEETTEETTAVASGGLALARCPGLIASLRPPRLAAPGAGQGEHTTAAARRSFAAASATLRVMMAQGWLRTCNGKQVRGTRSSISARGAAPRTLTQGGAALGRGVARWPRARRVQPYYAPRGAYEAAHLAARAAYDGVETAARRMSTMMTVKYDLIYVVMRLAPSFGRTRGKLRGAAGYRLEWPASRTRACLAEAEEAEETARCAWRASKRALRELWVECRRIRRCTTTAEVELARLKRMRAREVASRGGVAGSAEESRRERVLAVVAEMAAALKTALATAKVRLDKFYWGVWGSARRCRASEREVRALRTALREAEWGDWWGDLPGGSVWLVAAEAAIESDDQPGGDDVRGSDDEDGGSGGDNGGCGGASNGDNGGPASDTAPNGDTDGNGGSSVEAGGSMDDGRQAAGGGCAIGVWRSRLSGNTRGLQPGPEGSCAEGRRCEAAWEQAVYERNRGKGLIEGDGEETATCVSAAPVQIRLWQSWKHRRRRRFRRSFGALGGGGLGVMVDAGRLRRRVAVSRHGHVSLLCGANTAAGAGAGVEL